MFLCYYVAWPCDLDLWPFDHESVSCTVLLMSDPHNNFYYPTTVGYWVTSIDYLIIFPLSETVITHAPCHVTSNRRQKIVHIFEIPDPNLPTHFVTFAALRRRLSHIFPLRRLQILLCMRSVTWTVHSRSPKNIRNNFLTPNCLFTIRLLWGYGVD